MSPQFVGIFGRAHDRLFARISIRAARAGASRDFTVPWLSDSTLPIASSEIFSPSRNSSICRCSGISLFKLVSSCLTSCVTCA
jgi:hypothetical protein